MDPNAYISLLLTHTFRYEMARRPRKPVRANIADQSLFERAMRDVQPLEKDNDLLQKHQAPASTSVDSTGIAHSKREGHPKSQTSSHRGPKSNISAGLDRRTAQRLKRGQFPIEAHLDLHGFTQTQARHEFDTFLESSFASGKRCVLIITGKGSAMRHDEYSNHWAPPPGILRTAVPQWLNEQENRARVIAYCPAQPNDGGAGALYVLLRRQR